MSISMGIFFAEVYKKLESSKQQSSIDYGDSSKVTLSIVVST